MPKSLFSKLSSSSSGSSTRSSSKLDLESQQKKNLDAVKQRRNAQSLLELIQDLEDEEGVVGRYQEYWKESNGDKEVEYDIFSIGHFLGQLEITDEADLSYILPLLEKVDEEAKSLLIMQEIGKGRKVNKEDFKEILPKIHYNYKSKVIIVWIEAQPNLLDISLSDLNDFLGHELQAIIGWLKAQPNLADISLNDFLGNVDDPGHKSILKSFLEKVPPEKVSDYLEQIVNLPNMKEDAIIDALGIVKTAPIKPASVEMTDLLLSSSSSETPAAAVDKVSELRKFINNDSSCNKNDKLVTTLEKLIDDNKANPNPTSPYRGAGLKVEIAREGVKVTGLEIKEVFSPENNRFYDSSETGAKPINLDLKEYKIVAFDCSASHKKISALFEEKQAPGEAAKKIAEYFHQPGMVSFEIENKAGERKIIYCDNTKNKTAIFAPEVVKSAISSKDAMDAAQAQSTKWSSLSSILEKDEQKAIAIIEQNPTPSLHQPSATQTQRSNQAGRG